VDVVVVALLFVRFGSGVALLMVAVFVMVPENCGFEATTSVKVALVLR
jgi:hypothetical protein